MLGQAGWQVSLSVVERLWRREGLKVPKWQPKRRRLWRGDGSCVRLRPEHRGHVWSYDFVEDQTHNGRKFRMLNIIDEFSRENGYIESFNARLRDELLNGEIFFSLEEVRIVTGWWRDHYNRARPHSSLGYRPPAPETIRMPAWPLGSATLRLPSRLASEAQFN
ncbi:hypothetical protein GCM10019071_13680 [Sphingobium fuliginis]|uniref:Integrase catalytic domain-containing protein n=1 Tax=Sphingobium fuliginis (strain ATCC 27551) TaxID=336203 RepID=A0ABQ1ETQ1_SPHSA|nr:hypothetical protein GCM10019071_13680 [Sphingobium fuliginis]